MIVIFTIREIKPHTEGVWVHLLSVNFITTLRQISQLFAKYLRIDAVALQTLRPLALLRL